MESSNLYAAPIRPLRFQALGTPVVIPMIPSLLGLACMKIFACFIVSTGQRNFYSDNKYCVITFIIYTNIEKSISFDVVSVQLVSFCKFMLHSPACPFVFFCY